MFPQKLLDCMKITHFLIVSKFAQFKKIHQHCNKLVVFFTNLSQDISHGY